MYIILHIYIYIYICVEREMGIYVPICGTYIGYITQFYPLSSKDDLQKSFKIFIARDALLELI